MRTELIDRKKIGELSESNLVTFSKTKRNLEKQDKLGQTSNRDPGSVLHLDSGSTLD